MTQSLTLRFRPDARITEKADNWITIHTPESGTLNFRNLSPGVAQVFRTLANGGAPEAQLGETAAADGGMAATMMFYQYLHTFNDNALLSRTVQDQGHSLATITPMVRHFRYQSNLVDEEQAYVLSRFAYCRRDGDDLVVESPLGYAKATLHDRRAHALYGALSRPGTLAGFGGAMPELSPDAVGLFLNILLNARVIAPADEDGTLAEDQNGPLQMWDFHDLLFHARSRMGRHNNPYGGTFRFKGDVPPLPLVKSITNEPAIPLHKPDVAALQETDTPFTAVLESRRSLRYHDQEAPITLQELGEFLYRTARITHTITTPAGEPDYCLRPTPGGGAIHELEIYAVVDRCQGLESGIYHYNPLAHELRRVGERNQYVEMLLYLAWGTAAKKSKPQILFGITARFQRLQWKYESMVYAAVLKHVGALYQTMYLVATAMNLAPCALGGGNSDLFGLAAGLDYYAESLVGEFILGSKGTPPPGETNHV